MRSPAPALLLPILLVTAAGCGDGGRELPPPRVGEVRAVINRDPPSMSLIGKANSISNRIASQISEGLVGFDPELRLVPRVAESWEVSADGRTLTFTLRDGVRWHDGRPVSAADVAFTIEQVRDPLVESRAWSGDFALLESISTPDDRTVVARYAEARPDALEGWAVPLLPAHLAERGAELLTGEFQRHPVGCGPYRFVSYRRGELLELAANDEYWDGPPSIERLVFRIYPDQQTGYRALLTGDVDVMTVTSNLWLEARDDDEAGRLARFTYTRLSVWMVLLNQLEHHRLFREPGVRRALIHALDRETFVRTLMHGLGRVAVTSYHPDLRWADPALAPLAFDTELADRLLRAAGWRDADGDGVLDRDGARFELTLSVNASPLRIVDEMAAWIQQSWGDRGVAVTIEKLEAAQYVERRRRGAFDAMMGGISFTPSPDHHALYHSSMHGDGVNWVGFEDDEVDRLLEAGRVSFDPERRLAIYRDLQRRLRELQPLGWLFHFDDPVLHDRRLEGVRATPLGYWRHTAGPRGWRWREGAEGG